MVKKTLIREITLKDILVAIFESFLTLKIVS